MKDQQCIYIRPTKRDLLDKFRQRLKHRSSFLCTRQEIRKKNRASLDEDSGNKRSRLMYKAGEEFLAVNAVLLIRGVKNSICHSYLYSTWEMRWQRSREGLFYVSVCWGSRCLLMLNWEWNGSSAERLNVLH